MAGSGWSKGKIATVVVIVCLVLAAGAVGGILIFGKKSSKKTTTTRQETPTRADVIKTYQEISKQADEAMSSMEKVAEQDALSSSAPVSPSGSGGEPSTANSYQQELDQINEMFTQLEQDVSESSAAVIVAANSNAGAVSSASGEVSSAAGALSDTAAQYQQLYAQISAYYVYVEQLAQEALGQVKYLQSLIPSFQEMEQYQKLVTRIETAPPAVQRQLSGRLSHRAQAAMAKLNANPAPQSLASHAAGVQSIAQMMNGMTGQIEQALGTGNKQALSDLSARLNNTIAETQINLAAGLTNNVTGLSAGLIQETSKIDANLPGLKRQPPPD